MVREDLEDTYEKLKRRHKSYSKKSTPGNILFLVGLIILFWGTLFLLAIYGDILHPLIGLGLGIILTYIGIKSAAKSEPLELSNTEREFLNVFDAIKDLEFDFQKTEAAKKISKFEKNIYPRAEERRWALSAELSKDLLLFKQNLRDKLLPVINMGKEEEVEKAKDIIVNIAHYLLKPEYSVLEDLNKSLLELPSYVEKKEPLIQILGRLPILRHIFVEGTFFIGSLSFCYAGIRLMNISNDIAFYAAVTSFVTLTATYMALQKRK